MSRANRKRKQNPPADSEALWNFFSGEPYLDNPRLWIVNPKKERKKVRRRTRKIYSRNRRRTSRRRRTNAFVPLANPRRVRRHARRRANPFRKRYRRSNPLGISAGTTILGFPIKQVAIAGAAVVAEPFIERQLLGLLPTSISSTTPGRWAVKVGAAVATGYAAKTLLGQEAARLAFIVLGANMLADAVSEFMPATVSGMGYNVGLGAFGNVTQFPGGMGLVTPGMSARGPFTGVQSVAPVRAGQDPFASTF